MSSLTFSVAEAAACGEITALASRAKIAELAASITREINEPLTGVLVNASACLRMLAADPPNIDGALETMRRTIRDGNRASDMVKRLRAVVAKSDGAAERVDLKDPAREPLAIPSSDYCGCDPILRLHPADSPRPYPAIEFRFGKLSSTCSGTPPMR